MPDLPDIQPDAQRVLNRMAQQLGEAYGQIAALEDVVRQLQAERARATNQPAGKP